jgi:hypothetical protein
MKTTVEIPDALLSAARRAAARDGVTVRALVIEGLHRVLDSRKNGARFALRDVSFAGEGLHPDVADGSWARLRDLAYEGRGA